MKTPEIVLSLSVMKGLSSTSQSQTLMEYKIKLKLLEDELCKQLSSNLLLVPAVRVCNR